MKIYDLKDILVNETDEDNLSSQAAAKRDERLACLPRPDTKTGSTLTPIPLR